MENTWRVVGGSKGGIVVRAGKALASPELPDRLSKGALLRQRELVGERLHFERVWGQGPESGWVSTKVSGKDIVVRGGSVPLDKVDFGKPIIKSPIAAGTQVWLLADEKHNTMQAFCALALGLLKANYQVRLFGPKSSEILVRSLGIPFTVAGLTLAEFQGELTAMGKVDSLWDIHLWAKETTRRMSAALRRAVEASPKRPEVFCHTFESTHVAHALYAKYGIALLPCSSSVPVQGWDSHVHGYLHSLCDIVEEVFGASPFKAVSADAYYGLTLSPRQLVGLSAFAAGPYEALHGGEMHRDILMKVGHAFVGYWFLPAELQICIEDPYSFGGRETLAALEAFLKTGPAVYMGWGKKACGEYAGMVTALAVAALKALGLRGIVAAGGKEGPNAEALASAVFPKDVEGLCKYAQANVLFVPAAPHEWLFPRCACAVHHGGIGTVGAALRGSVPMVITPFEDKNKLFGQWVETIGAGVNAPGLWELTVEDLAKAIRQATQPAVKAKAKQIGVELQKESGVRNAVLGMNGFVSAEVKTGNTKEEWKKYKEHQAKEEAFFKELEEEPEDGVLRPAPEHLAAGPSSAPAAAPPPPGRGQQPGPARPAPAAPLALAAPPTPPWLKPDGKGKILTMCAPLKGHVIHFKRIAQWFHDRAPSYEVHMVLFNDEPNLPPGVIKHVVDMSVDAEKKYECLNTMFAVAAGLKPVESFEEVLAKDAAQAKETETERQDGSDVQDFGKIFLETFMRVRPNVVISEIGLLGLVMEGFLPALCKTYEALLLTVIPMCIKENKAHSHLRVQKTLEVRQKRVAQQAMEVWGSLDAESQAAFTWDDSPEANSEQEANGKEEGDGKAAAEKAEESQSAAEGEVATAKVEEEKSKKEGEAERPPWMPDTMSMEELNHIVWKVMPETQWQPPFMFLPSPSFFHAEKSEWHEVYCAPFLPLPSLAAGGAPQQSRAELEGSIQPELLDWLFSPESDDPIVYVAFGTIVSQFNSRALVERLVDALSDAPWRVLLVLPENARAGLPQEGDTNFWRWTLMGLELVKWLLPDVGKLSEGDVFTEEHFEALCEVLPKYGNRPALAELGVIVESRARAEALKPGRWRVESFVPQVHVLRCERVRCFISHNGANSTLESMACGVPMLCTPFYMDQYDWAYTVRQNLRAGIQVDKILTAAPSIRAAVQELLEDPAYRRNAQAVAKRIAAQAQALARALGPAMQPEASGGPGLSVLGAICVAHIKKKDVWPWLEAALLRPPLLPAAA